MPHPQPRNRYRRRAVLGATFAIGALVLGACSSQSSSTSASPSSSASQGAFPKTIDDAMGSVTIETQPHRIATLDTSYTDAALALGADIAAYTIYRAGDVSFPEYLGDVSAQTKDAVDVGSLAEPSLDKILDSNPNLIVSAKVRHEALYNQLTKIAPTLFSETTGPTWQENMVLLGDALGKKELAQELLDQYHERAKLIGQEIMAKQPDLTYSYLRFSGEDTARLYTTPSFFGSIMKDAGIPRPKDKPDDAKKIYIPLSQENILDADASLVVVSTYSAGAEEAAKSKKVRDAFESNPLWKSIHGEVMNVDDRVYATSVSIQGANAVLTELAEKFDVDPHLPAK